MHHHQQNFIAELFLSKDASKSIIVNNCYTEEDKAECGINKQKDAKNEVTYDVPNYFNAFNVFKCGINILDRIYVPYERACMPTARE